MARAITPAHNIDSFVGYFKDGFAYSNLFACCEDDVNGKRELHAVAEQQDHHHRGGKRDRLGRRIAHRSKNAEPHNKEDPDDWSVSDHPRSLRVGSMPVNRMLSQAFC